MVKEKELSVKQEQSTILVQEVSLDKEKEEMSPQDKLLLAVSFLDEKQSAEFRNTFIDMLGGREGAVKLVVQEYLQKNGSTVVSEELEQFLDMLKDLHKLAGDDVELDEYLSEGLLSQDMVDLNDQNTMTELYMVALKGKTFSTKEFTLAMARLFDSKDKDKDKDKDGFRNRRLAEGNLAKFVGLAKRTKETEDYCEEECPTGYLVINREAGRILKQKSKEDVQQAKELVDRYLESIKKLDSLYETMKATADTYMASADLSDGITGSADDFVVEGKEYVRQKDRDLVEKLVALIHELAKDLDFNRVSANSFNKFFETLEIHQYESSIQMTVSGDAHAVYDDFNERVSSLRKNSSERTFYGDIPKRVEALVRKVEYFRSTLDSIPSIVNDGFKRSVRDTREEIWRQVVDSVEEKHRSHASEYNSASTLFYGLSTYFYLPPYTKKIDEVCESIKQDVTKASTDLASKKHDLASIQYSKDQVVTSPDGKDFWLRIASFFTRSKKDKKLLDSGVDETRHKIKQLHQVISELEGQIRLGREYLSLLTNAKMLTNAKNSLSS